MAKSPQHLKPYRLLLAECTHYMPFKDSDKLLLMTRECPSYVLQPILICMEIYFSFMICVLH